MSELDTAITPRPKDPDDMGASLQRRAEDVKQEGASQLRHQLDERTTQAGRQVRSFAEALRRSGAELAAEDDGSSAARLADGAAERMERIGGYLEGASGNELLRDAEKMARERPWLVAGAAALAGFAASRLLKASSQRRYETDATQGAH